MDTAFFLAASRSSTIRLLRRSRYEASWPAWVSTWCGRLQSAASATACRHFIFKCRGRWLAQTCWPSRFGFVSSLRAQAASACSSCWMTNTTSPRLGPALGWRRDSRTTSHISLWRASYRSSTSFAFLRLESSVAFELTESSMDEDTNELTPRGMLGEFGGVKVAEAVVGRKDSSSHSRSNSWMCVSARRRSLWLTSCRISNTVDQEQTPWLCLLATVTRGVCKQEDGVAAEFS